MKEFKNKTAVITGTGSGISRGIAIKCSQEDMNVVLADINEKNLKRVKRKIQKAGGEVLTVKTDVSKCNEVENLAQKTLENYKLIHLLFNNAGVALPRLAWQASFVNYKISNFYTLK